ncbi:peptidoglycan editing factor PgeF [Aliidiomarina celeris]|uniref:peptidoglycan editing factor PgeF n=1 Tax=Aliidiomarina celeris TaxID=2249428 RepID=UPI000DE85DA8|nr:peptidoglycan editing factor PgeF [Aliidiomarina celeris]
MIEVLTPQWSVSTKVHALVTTRVGGLSAAPFQSLNLGAHVNDLPAAVQENRRLLQQQFKLPQPPRWLNQVHGQQIVQFSALEHSDIPEADGSYTKHPGVVLAVLTADCLPLFLTNAEGTEISIVHCGWRSIAQGIIEQALQNFDSAADTLQAWLGPAIGPRAFEVGDDVLLAMRALNKSHEAAFTPQPSRWLLNIYALVSAELKRHGVTHITGGEHCTFNQANSFFSYRRDGVTGRMASLIWIEE